MEVELRLVGERRIEVIEETVRLYRVSSNKAAMVSMLTTMGMFVELCNSKSN